MAPLYCYINLKTSLACPMSPTFGDRKKILLWVLTNSSVINTSLVSCFNLRAKELALAKYLLFSHFVSFVADSFPKCKPDPSCCSCMTTTKQNSKSLNPSTCRGRRREEIALNYVTGLSSTAKNKLGRCSFYRE